MRNRDARADVPLLIVDGRADKLAFADMEQDSITGVYLAPRNRTGSSISRILQVQILDFISNTLRTTSPIAPTLRSTI